MSFKPYTEKNGICSIWSDPEPDSDPDPLSRKRTADPDPHQNETDPKHFFMLLWNTQTLL